jgi:hypothetical protein
MKKLLLLCFFLSLVLASQYSKAQGLENFANYGETTNVYHDSTFLGQDGSTWQYFQCRGDSNGFISAPTPTMGKGRTPTAEITSGSISGGCGVISFQYKQAFSTGVSLDVLINGSVITTVTTSGELGVIKNSGDITVNSPGTFIIGFKQSSLTSGQVGVDNVTWTAYSGGAIPEPTDYPASFTATSGAYKVILTWTDAAGTQPPRAYLIKASNANSIVSPVDGTPVVDDPDLSDGNAAVNVLQGVQTYTFTGLPKNVPYYFEIFPYTNSGSSIDYKTSDPIPQATATTPDLSPILTQNWDGDGTFGDWITYSVTGVDQVWVIDTNPLHAFSLPNCAKMSGYLVSSFANEDWLISPAMEFEHSTNEILNFMSSYSFTGNPIEVKYSMDYDGTSDPNTATWTALAPTLSPGGFLYTPSGDVDLSAASGTNVRVAFKYTSTASASSTWEIDDVVISGIRPVGISEKPVNEFRIYPNPSDGMVNLKFNNTERKQVEIYSILGNSVYSVTANRASAQIDLSGLEKGIYFIKISDQNGSNPITKKLILQ